MEGFFIYLVKSCGILALFWCCFKLFLQRETFFTLHRAFLILGIAMALLFPLWTLTRLVTVEAPPYTLMEASNVSKALMVDSPFDWWQMAGVIYLIGLFFFLGRFALQLLSLRRLLKRSVPISNGRFIYNEVQEDTSPFSFFNTIVYNPGLHSPTELETILAHERMHSLQWHSLDILLIHLFSAFQWINPFVWWYRTTLSQNLEYIADQEVAKNMESCKAYQYLLLKNSRAFIPHSSIINPIFNSSIKKRIVMLNKSRSNPSKAWKFSLVIPFLAFFLFAFNTKTVIQVNPSTVQNNVDTDITKIVYTIDKTTTDADLKKIAATLKKDHKVDLLFKDITRNAEGYITAINPSFHGFGCSGSSSSSSDEGGIKPFVFSFEIDSDGELISIGYGSFNADKGQTGQNAIQPSDFSKILEVKSSPYGDPLFIVDGVEYKGANAPDLDPSEIQSINVLKRPEAIKKYGDKGKNGVVEIITKKNSTLANSEKNQQLEVDHIDSITRKKTQKTITITGNKTSETTNSADLNIQEKAQKTWTVTGYPTSGPDPDPLIIIDGVEKEADFDINSLSPDTIESIRVFKDGEAIKRFGQKGAKGVIDITTKKSGWVVGYGINTDDRNDLFNLDSFRQNGMEKAVIFVDGTNKGKNYVPTMKYSEIESIGTYRPGKSTTEKFGRQGKNGVIEITTKKK